MREACYFCEHCQCDICSVGRAYTPELWDDDPFVDALLDDLEEVPGDG